MAFFCPLLSICILKSVSICKFSFKNFTFFSKILICLSSLVSSNSWNLISNLNILLRTSKSNSDIWSLFVTLCDKVSSINIIFLIILFASFNKLFILLVDISVLDLDCGVLFIINTILYTIIIFLINKK